MKRSIRLYPKERVENPVDPDPQEMRQEMFEEQNALFGDVLEAIQVESQHLDRNKSCKNFVSNELSRLYEDPDKPIVGDFDTIVVPSDETYETLKQEYLKSSYHYSDVQWAWAQVLRTCLLKLLWTPSRGGLHMLIQNYGSMEQIGYVHDRIKNTIDGITITNTLKVKYEPIERGTGEMTVYVIDGLLIPQNLSKENEAAIFK